MSIKLTRKLPLVVLVAAMATLFLAQTAFAADSSVQAYGGSGGKVQANIAGPSDPGSPSADSTGSLPFTGMDLGLAGGGAIVLLAAGAAMGTFARRTRSHLE